MFLEVLPNVLLAAVHWHEELLCADLHLLISEHTTSYVYTSIQYIVVTETAPHDCYMLCESDANCTIMPVQLLEMYDDDLANAAEVSVYKLFDLSIVQLQLMSGIKTTTLVSRCVSSCTAAVTAAGIAAVLVTAAAAS
jgi:hypothetical protein